MGRDNISDFTTNLIKDYLARFTQKFARQHLDPPFRKTFALDKARFNYETRSWSTERYELPHFAGDFVLLTPIAILTKDDSWINRGDLLDRLPNIAASLPDEALRSEVNQYLIRVLPRDPKASAKDVREAIARVVERFPDLLDYYIHEKGGERGTRRQHRQPTGGGGRGPICPTDPGSHQSFADHGLL